MKPGQTNHRSRAQDEFRRAAAYSEGSQARRWALEEAHHARDLAVLDTLEDICAELKGQASNE